MLNVLQECYVHNLLRVTVYIPSIQRDVLEIVIGKMLKLDVSAYALFYESVCWCACCLTAHNTLYHQHLPNYVVLGNCYCLLSIKSNFLSINVCNCLTIVNKCLNLVKIAELIHYWKKCVFKWSNSLNVNNCQTAIDSHPGIKLLIFLGYYHYPSNKQPTLTVTFFHPAYK